MATDAKLPGLRHLVCIPVRRRPRQLHYIYACILVTFSNGASLRRQQLNSPRTIERTFLFLLCSESLFFVPLVAPAEFAWRSALANTRTLESRWDRKFHDLPTRVLKFFWAYPQTRPLLSSNPCLAVCTTINTMHTNQSCSQVSKICT